MFKTLSIFLFSIFFFIAGVTHFTNDQALAKITPLPYALEIVWVTGVMELLFAAFLLIPKYRRTTGILLALFLLAVLPANINMAVNNIQMAEEQVEPWLLWLRVALQFPLIIWILWATGVFGVDRFKYRGNK